MSFNFFVINFYLDRYLTAFLFYCIRKDSIKTVPFVKKFIVPYQSLNISLSITPLSSLKRHIASPPSHQNIDKKRNLILIITLNYSSFSLFFCFLFVQHLSQFPLYLCLAIHLFLSPTQFYHLTQL